MTAPSRRKRPRPSPVSVVLTVIGAVVVGIVLVGVVLNLATDPDVDVNLGDDVFEVGPARTFAESIADDGPLLFPAPVGDRDIFVQHIGRKVKEGWMSFHARAPGKSRSCNLEWQQNREVFVDPCDRKVYPADGAGLVHYKTTVNADGDVIVDLRERVESSTTTTSSAPTTTTAS